MSYEVIASVCGGIAIGAYLMSYFVGSIETKQEANKLKEDLMWVGSTAASVGNALVGGAPNSEIEKNVKKYMVHEIDK